MSSQLEIYRMKLSYLVDAYKEEHNRQDAIERKAQIFLGINGALFGIYASNITNLLGISASTGFGWVFFSSNILLIISSIFAYLAVAPQRYLTYVSPTEEFNKFNESDEEDFLLRKIAELMVVIPENRQINSSKSSLLNISAFMTTLGVILLILSVALVLL